MSSSPSSAEPAAIYARVSTLKQGEDWHTSLDVQAQEGLAFAHRHHFLVDPQTCIVKEPYTGTTLDRPAFERLLADMRRRGIHHLILDKPDRVTREGQLVASYFISRLQDLGITLHLALSGFSVHPGNETEVMVFNNFAFAAKLDNDQRVANILRTRREAARSRGRYVKGNRAPYGWRLEPAETDRRGRAETFRLVHDDGPDGTYPILLRILHERQAGKSYQRIASGLTADQVPTSAAHAGLRNASPTRPWHQSGVKAIIRDPINAGIVTAFRSRTQVAPPDARHAKRWTRQVPVPLSEQIMLPSDLVVDPPLTVAEYQWLISQEAYALRGDGKQRVVPIGGSLGGPRGRPKAADVAVGHGGLYRHAGCGGTMRVNYYYSKAGKRYTYYTCQRHADVPERCPTGCTVTADVLDALVWDAVVRDILLVPGKLAELAEQQRQADLAGDDPQSEVRRLRDLRADLMERRDNLADSISRQKDAFVRATLEAQLAKLGPQLTDADERLEDAQRRTANEAQRQAVLADVDSQVVRHALLLHLSPTLPTPARVSFQRRVLRALGFTATVETAPDGRLAVAAELRLAAGQPGLWFVSEDEQRQWDAALAEVLGRGLRGEPQEPVTRVGAEVGQVRFVTTTSSLCP